jgi:hypothetical protein
MEMASRVWSIDDNDSDATEVLGETEQADRMRDVVDNGGEADKVMEGEEQEGGLPLALLCITHEQLSLRSPLYVCCLLRSEKPMKYVN